MIKLHLTTSLIMNPLCMAGGGNMVSGRSAPTAVASSDLKEGWPSWGPQLVPSVPHAAPTTAEPCAAGTSLESGIIHTDLKPRMSWWHVPRLFLFQASPVQARAKQQNSSCN